MSEPSPVNLNDPIPEQSTENLAVKTYRICVDVTVSLNDIDMEFLRGRCATHPTPEDPEGLQWARECYAIERYLLHKMLQHPEVLDLCLKQSAIFELEENGSLQSAVLGVPENTTGGSNDWEWTDERIIQTMIPKLSQFEQLALEKAMKGRDLSNFTDSFFELQEVEIIDVAVGEVKPA